MLILLTQLHEARLNWLMPTYSRNYSSFTVPQNLNALVSLKPNSITLAGSKLVGDQLRTCFEPVSNQLRTR